MSKNFNDKKVPEKCSLCTQPVWHHSSNEGTHYYSPRPGVEAEVIGSLNARATKLEEAIHSALTESSWPLAKKFLRDALK